MSHFPCLYEGNKRAELGHLLPTVPDSARVIVEPFAGTGALSFGLYKADALAGKPPRHYVLNDRDPLLVAVFEILREPGGLESLHAYCREHFTPEEFARIQKGPPRDAYEWFCRRKVRAKRFDSRRMPAKLPQMKISKAVAETVEALRSGCFEVTAGDWKACAQAYAGGADAFIYFDPPYFSSFNQVYHGMDRQPVADDGTSFDNTQTFVDVVGVFETARAGCLLSINGVAIIRALCARWVVGEYRKMYSGTFRNSLGHSVRRATQHLIVLKRPTDSAPCPSPTVAPASPTSAGV